MKIRIKENKDIKGIRRLQELAGILKENVGSSNIKKLYSQYEIDCESNGLSLVEFQRLRKVSMEDMKAILTKVRATIESGEVEPFYEVSKGDLKLLRSLGFEDLLDDDYSVE